VGDVLGSGVAGNISLFRDTLTDHEAETWGRLVAVVVNCCFEVLVL